MGKIKRKVQFSTGNLEPSLADACTQETLSLQARLRTEAHSDREEWTANQFNLIYVTVRGFSIRVHSSITV